MHHNPPSLKIHRRIPQEVYVQSAAVGECHTKHRRIGVKISFEFYGDDAKESRFQNPESQEATVQGKATHHVSRRQLFINQHELWANLVKESTQELIANRDCAVHGVCRIEERI